MTLSPLFSTRIVCFVPRYCSAIKGLTLDLMPPVPIPIIICKRISHLLPTSFKVVTIDAMRPPKAAPCSIAVGNEVANRMRTPAV